MGRAQFEYDEVGNTFYYVIVSFFAVILFPLTHFLWPSLPKRIENVRRGCRCERDLVKRFEKEQIKPWERAKCVIRGCVLLVLWIIFILLAYKVSQLEQQYEEYDPYKILGLDVDADVTEIKKKYREMSKSHHPDKGGDAATFDAIVKAYKALTDEESRENWRLYGNPDGPKATTFGIALPKWIVSEQYGGWVLGFYALVFMVFLPVSVGIWWYNSIKYSADKVLLETTRIYYMFLQKTPNMETNRILMVLAGSLEFWKRYNVEIVERESDDTEIPRVMRELKNLSEKKKEPPFCYPWSIKARTLIHAYLSRVDLYSPKLETDQKYVIARTLLLLEEFLRIMVQAIHMPMHHRTPSIDSLENALRLFPMVVQALWPRNSGLLQLPHIREQNIPYLRRNRISTCQDLAKLNEFKRRTLLNTIASDQYDDIVYVLSMMPRLEIETRIEVQGEEDKDTITAGSLVTLKVTLKRFAMLDPERRKEEIMEGPKSVEQIPTDGNENADEQQTKRKVWEKQPKKKAKKGGKQVQKVKKITQRPNENAQKPQETQDQPMDSPSPRTKKETSKNEKNAEQSNEETYSDSERSATRNDDESDNEASDAESTAQNPESTKGNESNEDDDIWDNDETDDFFKKKDMLLDTEPTTHHEVHCPYYPGDKFEWWYLYLVEKKTRRLITVVVPCKTLDKEKMVELRFTAPPMKGAYNCTLHVRSDSYFDSDYAVDVKMEVHAAREPPQVKYEDTDDEELKDEGGSSEEYTEGSDSEQED